MPGEGRKRPCGIFDSLVVTDTFVSCDVFPVNSMGNLVEPAHEIHTYTCLRFTLYSVNYVYHIFAQKDRKENT